MLRYFSCQTKREIHKIDLSTYNQFVRGNKSRCLVRIPHAWGMNTTPEMGENGFDYLSLPVCLRRRLHNIAVRL
jgi:hypothetical protein